MRPSRNARVIYTFSFIHTDEKKVTVRFYSTLAPCNGADHAASHQLRRKWAISLLNVQPMIWAPLRDHEYLNFLLNKDFKYKQFKLVVTSSDYKIFIK